MEQYYYNRMNKIEQAVYHALYQGFLNIDEEIQIPRLEGEALYNVFFKLRLDHPEIFWATGSLEGGVSGTAGRHDQRNESCDGRCQ